MQCLLFFTKQVVALPDVAVHDDTLSEAVLPEVETAAVDVTEDNVNPAVEGDVTKPPRAEGSVDKGNIPLDDVTNTHSNSMMINMDTIIETHALSVIDGTHLISEEGLDLWIKHFAPGTIKDDSTFKISIPVSWFNFIIHLLLTPDKFGWTLHLLKSSLWQLLTAICGSEEFIDFHIPETCSVTQAPSCKMASPKDNEKENQGDNPALPSPTVVGGPLQQVSPNKVFLPTLGEAGTRKRRDKGPLIETEVRRSGRIRFENNGFKRNSCSGNICLPCNAIPPITHNKVVKNLTKSFCKVAEDELQEKLSKRPKMKEQGEVAKVSKATGNKDQAKNSK